MKTTLAGAGALTLVVGGLLGLPVAQATDEGLEQPQSSSQESVQEAAAETLITAPGSFNSQVGCDGDWQTDCAAVELEYNEDANVYLGEFEIPEGDYEFKIAEGGTWDLNWGQWGQQGGDNIGFSTDGTTTYILYSPETNYAFASNRAEMMTVPGSFQPQVGCEGEWQPECLATAMFPQQNGTFRYATENLGEGAYEFKIVQGMSWGGPEWGDNGNNVAFSTRAGELVVITLDPEDGTPHVEVANPPAPGAGQARALWIEADTIAWPESLAPAGAEFSLLGYPDVTVTAGELSEEQKDLDWRTKHASYFALNLTDSAGEPLPRATVEEILKGPIEIVASQEGEPVAQTAAQIPGVLDDLYAGAADETLGIEWSGAAPTLRLWAPTAENVELHLWQDGASTPQVLDAERNDNGVWSVEGEESWENAQYLWNVSVYVPSAGQVLDNLVTDPYSVGLTVNSTRSVIVNLQSSQWEPSGWGNTRPDPLRNESEQTIYELHVRDFSAWDDTVPEDLRGTYKAFTLDGTDGTNALRELSEAGITTIHLLPTFDIATTSIPELREDQQVPSIDGIELVPSNIAALEGTANWAPNSDVQQGAVDQVSNVDAFNWGYDPFHWTTPEGSYASPGNQDGGDRTREYREMVMALHDMDLRVVQDVVYNHTAAAGQASMSVLDKVVPGYYHRLNASGAVETSTCCSNTATEHLMMEKMMIDSLVEIAVSYHVDGFRFDLMGHHSLENMEKVRAALDELTVENSGVDGKSIYLYGEGWDFGEVAGGALFPQATQGNIAGTDIGAFNDRLRDGVRGGGPFDEDQRTEQGFGTGEFTDPNETAAAQHTAEEQEASLKHNMNLIRVGLAGSIATFQIPTEDGFISAVDVDYNGQPAAYTQSPQEAVNYVEAHDNETLFDNGIWKLPVDSDMDTRLRMQVLSNATVALGQSPSFWASGTELLRSKSLDRDSYNSGDWFNAIDWTGQWNQFGEGLPIFEKNGDKWDLMRPLLGNDALKPSAEAIDETREMSLDLLRLRSSSPLFTLGNAAAIDSMLTFPNAGANETPGVIVMAIDDTPSTGVRSAGTGIDPDLKGIVVVFNATPDTWSEQVDGMAGRDFELSPIQVEGADEVVKDSTWDTGSGTATVPARTVAVFVEQESETPVEPPVWDGAISAVPDPVSPGGTLTINGEGWLPGSSVTISVSGSDSTVTVRASDDGRFETTMVVPDSARAGELTLTATDESGNSAQTTVTVKVSPEGPGEPGDGEDGEGGAPEGETDEGGTLPVTGAMITIALVAALVALAVGMALRAASRKNA